MGSNPYDSNYLCYLLTFETNHVSMVVEEVQTMISMAARENLLAFLLTCSGVVEIITIGTETTFHIIHRAFN